VTVEGHKKTYLYNIYIFILVFIFFTFLAYSCAPTYTPVYPEPVNIKTIIKPGDTVKVTTKDEKEYEFIAVEITDNAIVGETDKVLFTDIYKLQEMVASSGENTAKGIAGTVFIVILGAAGAAGSAAGAVRVP